MSLTENGHKNAAESSPKRISAAEKGIKNTHPFECAITSVIEFTKGS